MITTTNIQDKLTNETNEYKKIYNNMMKRKNEIYDNMKKSNKIPNTVNINTISDVYNANDITRKAMDSLNWSDEKPLEANESICMCFNTTTSTKLIDLYFQIFSATCWNLSFIPDEDVCKHRDEYLEYLLLEKDIFKSLIIGFVLDSVDVKEVFRDAIIKSQKNIMYTSLYMLVRKLYLLLEGNTTKNLWYQKPKIKKLNKLIEATETDMKKLVIPRLEKYFLSSSNNTVSIDAIQKEIDNINRESSTFFKDILLDLIPKLIKIADEGYIVIKNLSAITDSFIEQYNDIINYLKEVENDIRSSKELELEFVNLNNVFAERIKTIGNKHNDNNIDSSALIEFLKEIGNDDKFVGFIQSSLYSVIDNSIENNKSLTIKNIDIAKKYVNFATRKYNKYFKYFRKSNDKIKKKELKKRELYYFMDLLFKEFDGEELNEFLTFDNMSAYNVYLNFEFYARYNETNRISPETIEAVFGPKGFPRPERLYESEYIKTWDDLVNIAIDFRFFYENGFEQIIDIKLNHVSLVFTVDTYPANVKLTLGRKAIYSNWLIQMKRYIEILYRDSVTIDCFIYHSPVNVKGSVIRNTVLQGVNDWFVVFHDDDDKARPFAGIMRIINSKLDDDDKPIKNGKLGYPIIPTCLDSGLLGPWSYILVRPAWILNDYSFSPFFMCGEDAVLLDIMRNDPRYLNYSFDDMSQLDFNNTYKFGFNYFYLLASNRYNTTDAQEDWENVWKADSIDFEEKMDKSKFENHDHHIDEIVEINITNVDTNEEENVKFWSALRIRRKQNINNVKDIEEFNNSLKDETEYIFHGGILKNIIIQIFKWLLITMLVLIVIIYTYQKYNHNQSTIKNSESTNSLA